MDDNDDKVTRWLTQVLGCGGCVRKARLEVQRVLDGTATYADELVARTLVNAVRETHPEMLLADPDTVEWPS